MTKHLLLLAVLAPLTISTACAGPDCSTGAYQGSVFVEDDTVFNFVTAQVKEPIGSVHDRDLFRGCTEISGFLFLSRPSVFDLFDEIEVVSELETIQRGETDRELWTLPQDAFPNLTEVRGLLRNGGARVEGLNSVERIGRGLGICTVPGLNSLRVAGELGLSAGLDEDSRCDQSGLVSLEEIEGDLTVTGFEDFEIGSNLETEDIPFIDWPSYSLPGEIRTIGGSLVIGMFGSFEAPDLVTVGHNVRIDNTVTGGQPADVFLPVIEEVGFGFWFLGGFLREVSFPEGLQPNHAFFFQLQSFETLTITNNFGPLEAVVAVANGATPEEIESFVPTIAESIGEVILCGNRQDVSCEDVDFNFVFEEPSDEESNGGRSAPDIMSC